MNNTFEKVNNVCLIIIASFVVAMTLVFTRSAMIPFVFSIFLYATLKPLVSWIQSHAKLPRALATTVAILALAGTLTLAVFVVVTSINNFIEGASQYRESLQQTFATAEAQLGTFNIQWDLKKLSGFAQSAPVLRFAQSLTGQLLSILGNILLVFIFTLFLLAGESVRAVPRSPFVDETMAKISTYITAKFFLSLATGLLVWVTLAIFKVEMAFIFALVTLLLNFIPTVGSMVATVLPIPILILQYNFGYQFWAVILICIGIQVVIGNIVESKVLGESMDLHPITVLICLIFWGLIWGIAGMFLAVPITAILKIILARIPSTKTFSEVLAGRMQ